jgi:hypothetical protein
LREFYFTRRVWILIKSIKEGIFIIIKFSMGTFNIGGNHKIKVSQMKEGCATQQFLLMKYVLLTMPVEKS